jgi:hypothetical protein
MKIHGTHPVNFLLMLLPLMASGCCTYMTVTSATYAHRFDTVQQVKKVELTPDNKIVILVNGSTAESSKIRPLTITKCLLMSKEEENVWIHTNDIAEGWMAIRPGATNALEIAPGPTITYPAFESAIKDADKFPDVPGSERILYLIRYSKPDKRTSLLYVSKVPPYQKIEIRFGGRDISTPSHYPLLLLTPLALATDIVMIPFEIPLVVVVIATDGMYP